MKTDTKHNQGPWEVHYSLANENLASVTTRNREPIAPCVGENAEANARLIAAAPELLACLKDLLDNAEIDALNEPDLELRCDAARAAILKAEGNA
jgi:hypothetical protein